MKEGQFKLRSFTTLRMGTSGKKGYLCGANYIEGK